MKKHKTYSPKPNSVEQKWHFIDARGQVLGRLATDVASLLIGKHKAEFTPHWNFGDKVVVTNASKVAVTGRKKRNKVYFRHTGYPGGVKKETLGHLLEEKPEEVIRRAVKGMLPKNKWEKKRMASLYVYPGEEHPHKAQEGQKA